MGNVTTRLRLDPLPTSTLVPSVGVGRVGFARAKGLSHVGNELSGMTMFANRGFDDSVVINGRLDESETYGGAVGWSANSAISNGNYSIVSDPTAPVSPPNVAKITYRSTLWSGFDPMGQIGSSDNYASAAQQLTLPVGKKTMYTRQRIMLSPDWNTPAGVGAQKDTGETDAPSVVKLGFIARGDDSAFAYYVLAGTSSPFELYVAYNMSWTNSTTHHRNVGSAGDENFSVAAWHDLETLMVMNSAPGVFDGKLKIWLDGKLIIDTDQPPYNNTTWNKPEWWQSGEEGSPQSYFGGPKLSPTWGGADFYRNTREFYAYWDHFYVSAKV